MEQSGKRVLVTGSSSGIGAEISREVVERGAEVTMVARGAQKLESLATELRSGGGPPDVLINNASAGIWRATWETEPGYAEQAARVPYLAAYELTRFLLPAMRERGSGWKPGPAAKPQ